VPFDRQGSAQGALVSLGPYIVRHVASCAVLALTVATSPASVMAAPYRAGSQVEGHIGSDWSPCTVVGEQAPTGGYHLHCDALPDPDHVFSESDVRPVGRSAFTMPAPPAAASLGRAVLGHIGSNWVPCNVIGLPLRTGGIRLRCDYLDGQEAVFSASDVREVNAPAAAPQAVPAAQAFAGRPVQGHVGSAWVDCTMIGGQLPTGGYQLHCDSLPDPTNVFSASDVREIGGARAVPPASIAAAAQGRRVQGFFAGAWIDCTMIGNQTPTGGYLLRCDANPGVDAIFSASDVRF
jgi:hypothetical protein